MALPLAVAALFGNRLYGAGKSLVGQFKSIGRNLEKHQAKQNMKKAVGSFAPKKEIKTAKPKMVKPKPVEVSPEEKAQVLQGLYGLDGGYAKSLEKLTPKENAVLAPEKIKGTSKAKATRLGKKMDAKKPSSFLINSQGLAKQSLEQDLGKTPWKKNKEARDLFGL